MNYGIFNMRTDVNACNCTRGCSETVRESALNVDSLRKIPCHTKESNLHWQHAGLMLYRLSYIPTPVWDIKQPHNYIPKGTIHASYNRGHSQL